MRIENIRIKNYRLFRDAELRRLPDLTIVVGANGSGKSTLFDVFTFLKDALTHNVAAAVTRRGGFRELVSRGTEGPIGITVQFRESGGRLATYILEIATENGQIVVAREVLRYRRGRCGKPWHFVDFSCGEGSAITNESVYGQEGAQEQREEFKLDDPGVLAIKGLGEFQKFRVVCQLRRLIEKWQVADASPCAEEGCAEHVSTSGYKLAWVARNTYLQRVEDPSVIVEVVRDGVGLLTWEAETFAYAEGYDEEKKRYLGVRAGVTPPAVTAHDPGLVVRPEVARRQMDEEVGPEPGEGTGTGTGTGTATGTGTGTGTGAGTGPGTDEGRTGPKRFHGSVDTAPLRAGKAVAQIAEEVVSHMESLVGSKVKLTLEIEAEIPDGAPEHVVRTVTENARTLGFRSQGFEEE